MGFESQVTRQVNILIAAGVLFDKRIASQPSWLHYPAATLLLDPALYASGSLQVSF
jgi:hypothetical protein